MPNIHEPQLINTIGHSAGAIIFGIFIYLMLRDRSATKLRGSWLSFAAAGLAFLWNIGSLAVLFASGFNSNATGWVVFLSLYVLSFLPAVLLHISLEGSFAPIIVVGYGLSVIAVWMHLLEIFNPAVRYHQQALLLITIGFGILTVVSIIAVVWQGDSHKHAKASRIFGAMCCLLLAMSFVHFGSGHASQVWSKELLLHHAGIPLALFVLLQDYRFVLFDAFIRFLANALLAAVLTFIAIRITFNLIEVDSRTYSNPLHQTLLVYGICLLLIVFAHTRGHLQQWLTKVVFRRVDLNKALQEMQSQAALFGDELEFLSWARGQLAQFMSTERAEEVPELKLSNVIGETALFQPAPVSDIPRLCHAAEFAWAEAIVPLRLGQGDIRYVLLGRRRGGRRYLSEDLQALSRLTTVIVEQIERIRKVEMHRLVSQAELRALQAQINPHFLFNALNTLYGIIPREAAGARKTVLNLAEIFRYFLQSDKALIKLSEELEIVKAYLDIERLRLGPRLEVNIDVDEAALGVPIPILSVQPLVENAIKHGLSRKLGLGALNLKAKISDGELLITIEDNGPGFDPQKNVSGRSRAGIGLANVQRRLQLCYGLDADLVINSDSEGTRIEFGIPLAGSVH